MSLLISCGAFHPSQGGAESLFLDLSRSLGARGHRVTVVTRRVPGTASREQVDGLDVIRLSYPLPYEALKVGPGFFIRSPAVLFHLWRLLHARRISTVCIGLLDMSAAYLLALRWSRSFRLVVYLHGGETRVLPRQSRAFRKLLERCLMASDAVVAVSPGIAEDALRVHPPVRRRLSVISNGIVTSAVADAPAHRRDRAYILYAGRLAAVKKVDTIIRAFARVAELLDDVDLVLLGTGPEREDLVRLSAALGLPPGRVEVVGAVERHDVFSYMKGALYLVLASEAEGHPLVALEAFVAGKAVIGPRVPGIMDVVEPGLNGALYPPGDEEELSKLMAHYALDAAARRALESRIVSTGGSRYDLEGLLDRHVRILSGAA